MVAKRFRRGDFVKYIGSIQRYNGTWWTVKDVATTRGNTTYTLHVPGIGRLCNVRTQSVTDTRDEA